MGRGSLILIEGLDRAGKTTQTGRLVDKLKLNGVQVDLLKFPGMLLINDFREKSNINEEKQIDPLQ